MTLFLFNRNDMINFQDTFYKSLTSSSRFNEKMLNIFSETYSEYIKTIIEDKNIVKDLPEFEKIVRHKLHNIFNSRFREADFVDNFSDIVSNYSDLVRITGFGQVYQNFANLFATWNNNFIEPIRDTLWRTSSHKICSLEKYSLFRYDNTLNNVNSIVATPTVKTPVLVVYAFINRHYLLDLLPEISVINNLLKQGFNIYSTDWGTPSVYDKDLTIGHFINKYMDKSVDLIRKTTNSDKISLFGYCWGGDLVLLYAALHPEKVKNVVTVATPGDFSLDDTLLSVWSKRMDVDALLDTFGNAPSILFNSAFALRNPVENISKYPHFFEQPRGLESMFEFFATEMWLNDSRPVIGEIYREFIKYCYQQNLLIKNQMKVDDKIVDLKNINMPFLNVMAQRDDLVAPRSSAALMNAVGSSDKSVIEFPSGHVGLIIGQRAHKEVWPKVGEWLRSRS